MIGQHPTTSSYDASEEPEESFFSGDSVQTQIAAGHGFRTRFVADGFSERLSVIEYEGAIKALVGYLLDAARARGFGKIFLKTRKDDWEAFISLGFVLEGIIKEFFRGEDAYAMARFLSAERRHSPQLEKENQIVEDLLFNPSLRKSHTSAACSDVQTDGADVDTAAVEDAEDLARLYGSVFDTYPTPLNRPEYVVASIHDGAIFKVIRRDGRIVSAASAAPDYDNSNAEMTDCATLKEYRGHGMMRALLKSLEETLRGRSVACLYSMARSTSYGMNRVFHRLGYHYQGRLINHCHIMGQFEDMNLWVKSATRPATRTAQ
ncbi:MAG: putative beta-lysine N-acetyltransferase [Bacillota bacterium]